ncbi:MAG: hypothetical protein RJA49_933 [Actinomycetota bacterium]|jgi:Family of unknown function (DUF6325)
MAIGPVEYIVIQFPGNQFKGEIIPALAELIDSKTIRLVDVAFISKDDGGNVVWDEYDAGEEGDGFGFAHLDGEAGLLNEDDVLKAAEVMDDNSTAALLVWEDLWAAKFAAAVRNAGGELIVGGRIPHELVLLAEETY